MLKFRPGAPLGAFMFTQSEAGAQPSLHSRISETKVMTQWALNLLPPSYRA